MPQEYSWVSLPHEAQLAKLIEEDDLVPEIRLLAEKFLPSVSLGKTLLLLRKEAIELTRSTHNMLYSIMDTLVDKFGADIDEYFLFRSRGGGTNAILYLGPKSFAIDFRDEILLNLESDNEVKWLLGHELGHYLLGHGNDPVKRYLLDIHFASIDGNELSAEEKELLNTQRFRDLVRTAAVLRQLNELSADRMGLISSGDINSAISAAIKIDAGPMSRYGTYNVQSYVEQGRKIISAQEPFSMEEVCATHPYEPLRAVALDLFYRSPEYRQVYPSEDPVCSSEEFEKALKFIVPIENVYREKAKVNNDREYDNDMFMYMVIGNVVEADGKLGAKEKDYLANYISSEKHFQEISKFYEEAEKESYQREYERLCNIIKEEPSRRKTSIMKTLLRAAALDGNVVKSEIDEIVSIAEDIGALSQCSQQLKRKFGFSL